MFDFQWPWAALLLPLPLLVPLLWPVRAGSGDELLAGRRQTLLHPRLESLEAAFVTRRPRRRLAGWSQRLLLALIWSALVLALMGPRWLVPHTEVSTPGYDLMLAVDGSHSMDALDFTVDGRQVSRMAVVKGVMGRFLDRREGDRLGLIFFGSQAYVLAPLTLDRLALHQLLDGLTPGVAGPATALGDAIALGVSKLRERPAGSRVMVVIADGDNNAGSFAPEESARLAADAGVRIHVIGVGSRQTSIPIPEHGVLRYRDDLTMNEDRLRQVAALTGGAYFRATDAGALEEISARIDGMEKTTAQVRTAYLPQPLYRWPLGVGLLVLLVLGLFPDGRLHRVRGGADG